MSPATNPQLGSVRIFRTFDQATAPVLGPFGLGREVAYSCTVWSTMQTQRCSAVVQAARLRQDWPSGLLLAPVAQNFGERMNEGPWLGQLDNVSLGHGVSLLRWRSGGVEHHHDTPPYPFMPSPTSAHSSLRCPGEPIRHTGLPNASPAAWIFVFTPPRERPRPWASAPPLFRRAPDGVLMGAHDGKIDHQPFQVGFTRQRHQHVVQNTHFDPAIIAPLYRVGFAEPLGKSRQRPPERAIHNSAFRNCRLSARGPRLPLQPPGINPDRRFH